MIRADFFVLPDGGINGFQIEGHANYAEAGMDIICSAVSSAAFMALNTVTDVLHVTPFTLRAEEGFILLRVENRDISVCKDIFEGLKIHLQNLEEQYKDYICVRYMEV